MPEFNRWNHEPDVEPQGEEFLASSSAFPGVYGEGETREEAIESFWQMVDFIGGLARAPDWPHDRSPYVDDWETLAEDEFAPGEDDELWKVDEDDDDLPPLSGEPWNGD
jgi:hypothetical protein